MARGSWKAGDATAERTGGGSYWVATVQLTTTADTALSAKERRPSVQVATSTCWTSCRVEVPWLMATRACGGLSAVVPASRNCWKVGDKTENNGLRSGELVAVNDKSLRKDDSSRGGGPPCVPASDVAAPKSLVPIQITAVSGRGLGAWRGVGPKWNTSPSLTHQHAERWKVNKVITKDWKKTISSSQSKIHSPIDHEKTLHEDEMVTSELHRSVRTKLYKEENLESHTYYTAVYSRAACLACTGHHNRGICFQGKCSKEGTLKKRWKGVNRWTATMKNGCSRADLDDWKRVLTLRLVGNIHI